MVATQINHKVTEEATELGLVLMSSVSREGDGVGVMKAVFEWRRSYLLQY